MAILSSRDLEDSTAMQLYKIGLTLLVIVSTPLITSSTAVFFAIPTSTQTQDTRIAQADQLFQQGFEQYQKGHWRRR
jgi:hypothetical protein